MPDSILSLYPHPHSVGWNHDTSAAIITRDGEIFAQEESKFTQHNYDYQSRWAELACTSGFQALGITPADIDHIVTGTPWGLDGTKAIEFICRILKVDTPRLGVNLHYVPHSLAHASHGFYSSDFEYADILVMDGGGDNATPDSLVHYRSNSRNNKIAMIKNHVTADFGTFHNLITEICGFGLYENGKTTGLAAYGAGRDIGNIISALESFITSPLGDKLALSATYPRSPYNIEKFNPSAYKRWNTFNTVGYGVSEYLQVCDYPDDLVAAAGQYVFEKYVLAFIQKWIVNREGFTGNLVCVGGIFQNVNLVNRLREALSPNRKVFVPNGCNDSGLALGQLLGTPMYQTHNLSKKRLSPYIGYKNPALSAKICSDYEKSGVIRRLDPCSMGLGSVAEAIASLLASGAIIGLFNGRCELGPRSLGARSVIADPRRTSNKMRLNLLLKKRDWFMPFAPSILQSRASLYLKEYDPTSLYMTEVFYATDVAREQIPAAIHVDGSTRPHIVIEGENKFYHDIISHFLSLTGVGCVLNTSFNRHGIPTINTAQQAIEHLACAHVDYIVVDETLFELAHKDGIRTISEHESIPSEFYYLLRLHISKALDIIAKNGNIDSDFWSELISGDLRLISKQEIFNAKLKGTEMTIYASNANQCKIALENDRPVDTIVQSVFSFIENHFNSHQSA